jgi:RND family efflux transporter MFP subunit
MDRLKIVLIATVTCLLLAACATNVAPEETVVVVPTQTPTSAPPTPDKPVYTVTQASVPDEIRMPGRVTSVRNQDVFFQHDGFLAEVLVQRGDRVNDGQLLARLDPGTLPEQLRETQEDLQNIQESIGHSARQRQLNLQSAQLALENAQDNLAALQQPPGQAEVEAAYLAIEAAEINLEDVKRTASTAKTNAQLALEQAANAVRNAQDRFNEVYHASYGSDEERERAIVQAERAIADAEANLARANRAYVQAREAEVTAVRRAEQQLEAAQLDLEELLAPPDPLEIAAAEREVQQARVRLNAISLDAQDPTNAQRAEQTRRRIAELQQELAEYSIYAPFAGEISEVIARAGEQVPAYAPIVNVMDPSALAVAVSDYLASDLNRINVDQPVTLSFARYPDQSFPGKVSRLPITPTGSGDATVQTDPNILVDFERAGMEFEFGDLAEVVIDFGERRDALWLPSQAVRSFDDEFFVVVREGDQERRVDIEVGITHEGQIEVVSGLSAGDTVVAP